MAQRPPADKIINEAFYDKKCGQPTQEDRLDFLNWCMKGDSTIKTRCRGISGSEGLCEFEATFSERHEKRASPFNAAIVFYNQTLAANKSDVPVQTGDNSTPPQYPLKPGQWNLNYDLNCNFGGPKWTNKSETVVLDRSEFETLYYLCKQELYGAPYAMPWWLIVLIVLIVLSAVGVAMSLFWKFWLRSKIIAMREPAFSSSYTSAPYSSTSGIQSSSSRARSSLKPSSSRRLSSTSRLPISGASSAVPVSRVSGFNGSSVLGGGSSIPSGGRSGRASSSRLPSYMMSREPSVRSTRTSSSRR